MDKAIQEKRERDCYGCTIEEFKNSTFLTDWNDPFSILLLSTSILSDIQEGMNIGVLDNETIRKDLNISKWLIGEATRVQKLKDRITADIAHTRGYKEGRNSGPGPYGE